MNSRSADCVIAGGGLVGKALALALAQSGLHVELCGAQPAAPCPATGYGQRIYALNAASRRFLEGLRVWGQVPAQRVQSVERMQISADGAALGFDAYAQEVEALAWIVESDAIERALDLALQFERRIRVTPTHVLGAARRDTKWHLQLADGSQMDAGLLVGADGRASRAREWARIGVRIKPYRQKGIVCNFRCAGSHGAAAFQTFTERGVIALLPLPDQNGEHQVSLVWSAPDGLAEHLCAEGPEQLAAHIQNELPRLAATGLGHLEPAGSLGSWPLVLQRADSLVADGFALVGDAAHVVHPLAGHGLNLGLQDAAALSAVMGARASSRDVGDARLLRRYARARAEQVAALEFATDGLHSLYSPGRHWLSPLRALGLSAVNHLPPVKRWLAGYASGLAVLG